MEEESIIESFVRVIEGTKSTAEFIFSDLSVKMPGMNASVVINGTVSITARPIHEKSTK
ncbi:MAG: hypothetical protein M1431_04650 [Candidatus Thermoplasmatota archaeon]|nr:hypothetical protein [Candidatus Thermoplasmatota archaeon]